MAFNSTNVNKQVVQKVVKAASVALKYPNTDIKVFNRKGVAFLFVRCYRFNSKNYFAVYDMKGENMRYVFSCVVWKKGVKSLYHMVNFFVNYFLYPKELERLLKDQIKKLDLSKKEYDNIPTLTNEA